MACSKPALISVFVVLLSAANCTFGQSKIDSLNEVLTTSIHDTVRVRTYLALASAYEKTDFDSALYYFNHALSIAQATDMKAHPRYIGLVLERIGSAYYSVQRNKEKLTHYLKKAMAVHADEGLLQYLADTEFSLATYYANFSKYDSAVYHFDQIIERNLANKTNYHMATSYSSSGLNSYYLRNLDVAASLLLEGIRYSITTGDTARLYAPYLNYGLVLKEQKEYEKAKQYMRASQQLLERIDHKRGVALTYSNIGQVLILQDSLDAAFQFLSKAWEIDSTLGRSAVGYYNNIAWIEKQRANYDAYHQYATEAVNSVSKGYAPKSKADVYGTLVNAKLLLADSVYSDISNERNKLLREALPYAEEGWILAESVESGNVKLKLAELLSDVYTHLGRYEEALKFNLIAKQLSEEINNQERTNAIARMAAMFETEKVASENTLLQERGKRQTAQLKQQRYLIISAFVVLMLIIVIAFIVQGSRLKLKRANYKIEKSLEEKELLLKEIHHRVKNNLQVISSLLDLQSREIEDAQALSTFMEGQNRVKAMALIHQMLYQNENLAAIDFAQYAQQLLTELSAVYSSGNAVKTSIHSEGKTNFDIDTAIPLGLILNELISNAFKYAFKGGSGELNISIQSLGKGQHQMVVADSGPGLSADFDLLKVKSLGLRLVRRLAKQLYGKADYYFETESKFIVTFTDTLERNAS